MSSPLVETVRDLKDVFFIAEIFFQSFLLSSSGCRKRKNSLPKTPKLCPPLLAPLSSVRDPLGYMDPPSLFKCLLSTSPNTTPPPPQTHSGVKKKKTGECRELRRNPPARALLSLFLVRTSKGRALTPKRCGRSRLTDLCWESFRKIG